MMVIRSVHSKEWNARAKVSNAIKMLKLGVAFYQLFLT